MKSPLFRIEALSDAHDRASFQCGEEALDRYFQTQATQDIRRRVANCFVAVEIASGRVAGFYTLSAASIAFVDLPREVAGRLPRYPTLPAVRIGRLAVDTRFQRRGLGEALLMSAADQTARADAAAYALLVEAKNDQAVSFYQRYGFRALAGQPRTLFLPVATAKQAFAEKPPGQR
jgi:ribosomal protein S18 acetylase RimI-like enzyme